MDGIIEIITVIASDTGSYVGQSLSDTVTLFLQQSCFYFMEE